MSEEEIDLWDMAIISDNNSSTKSMEFSSEDDTIKNNDDDSIYDLNFCALKVELTPAKMRKLCKKKIKRLNDPRRKRDEGIRKAVLLYNTLDNVKLVKSKNYVKFDKFISSKLNKYCM